jgi:hypothetical protein
MKLSKELNDALDAISKEVESWPSWKRRVELRAARKVSEAPTTSEASIDAKPNKKITRLVRAAKA